jgi:hypothetical protein
MRNCRVIAVLSAMAVSSLAAAPALAQTRPAANISGGYSALREHGTSDAFYRAGWTASFATTPPSGLGWTIEAGGNYRRPAGISQRLVALLGGVRFTAARRARMVPFAQGLAGLERYSETGFSENGFAVQPGAGLDLFISNRTAIRVEVDYRWVRADPRTFNELRLVAGVSFAFGSRP